MQPEVFSIFEGKKALHRSAEPKRVRKSSRQTTKDDAVEAEADLSGLSPDDMMPLLAEKFAMEAVVDPASLLEARLTAMAGLLWEPLLEEDEPEEAELQTVVPQLEGAETGESAKKPRRRRRSNKMTIAEAIGLAAAEDAVEATEGAVNDSLPEFEVHVEEAMIPQTEEVEATVKKTRRRRKTKKKVNDSPADIVSEASSDPMEALTLPEATPAMDEAERVDAAGEPEEAAVKKSKRRRRKKKKPTEDAVIAAEQQEMPAESVLAETKVASSGVVEEPEEVAVKKSKRRRRKKKKPLDDIVVTDEPIELSPESVPALDAANGADETGGSEEAAVKKTKRRRRKKKKPAEDAVVQVEPPETKELPAKPAAKRVKPTADGEIIEQSELAVKKTKRRRRRSSTNKKNAAVEPVVEIDQPEQSD
jgi:hypothetical protein